MKKLILISLAALILDGCKKSDSVAPGTPGRIRYSNNSDDNYEAFFQGYSLGVISKRSYKIKDSVLAGTYHIKAVQLDGYILWPTVWDDNVTILDGQEYEVKLPY